jgi:hypothetical protein
MPKEKGGKLTDLASISLLFNVWRGFVGKMWYASMTFTGFLQVICLSCERQIAFGVSEAWC